MGFCWCKPTWDVICDFIDVLLPPLLSDSAELLCFAELCLPLYTVKVSMLTQRLLYSF